MYFFIGIGLLIIGVSFILWMKYENKALEVTYYKACFSSLPKEFDGMKIVLLTDLHNNEFGLDNKRLLEEIRKQHPDCIMVAGDMLTSYEQRENQATCKFMKQLAKEYTIYYSNGNHEQRLSENFGVEETNYEKYKVMLQKYGVRQLINTKIRIKRGKKEMEVIGLEIPLDYYKRRNRPIMSKEVITNLIGEKEKNQFTILLAHNPMYFKQYVKWGADLVLSGHLHGGMIRLPKLGGVISPQYRVFPKYDAGLFREENTIMILSRGLGMHTIKVRIFNRPELAIVELKREK